MIPSKPYDVIVVGGGVSGLVAAHYLAKANRRVLVLEARERLGGRVNTISLSPNSDHKVDLGASYVHGTHGNPLVEMAKKLKMELHFISIKPGVMRSHDGQTLDKDLEAILVDNAIETMFTHLRQSAQASLSNPEPNADESLITPYLAMDSPLYLGLASKLERTQASYLARSYSGWCGADLDDVSYKWWGFEQDTQGPDAIVISGYVTLIDWLKEEINRLGSEIRVGEEVVEIAYVDDRDTVTVTTSPTERRRSTNPPTSSYTAPYALITLPLGVLQHRPPVFKPPLPPRRLAATNRLGSGLLNKVFVYYAEAWWDSNETFFFLPDPSNPTNLLGRAGTPAAIFVHNLWTLQKTPALCFFMGGEAAEKIEALSDGAVWKWGEDIVKQHLGRGKIVPPATKVLATRWRSDPFALGSYSYIPTAKPNGTEATPLDMIEMSHALWGRLYFAGEHTEPDEYASVHAAWNSGLREGRKLEIVLDAADKGEESGVQMNGV